MKSKYEEDMSRKSVAERRGERGGAKKAIR